MLVLNSDFVNDRSFKSFLTENNSVRMEHVEDKIFSAGYEGATDAIGFLRGVKQSFESNVDSSINVTTKWDGSPGLYCGINPENGKFFVATQKLMNKEPVVNYTEQDVDKNHGDKGDLTSLMKVALRYLPKLQIQDILQGDVMFGPDDVKTQTIDGVNYYTFKPNTIMYAVPVNSQLGKRIANAKFGIIFHTKLTGKSLKDLKKSYNVDVSKLNNTPDVWFDDATYTDQSGTVTLTDRQADQVEQHLNKAEKALENIGSNQLNEFIKQNQNLVQLIYRHINYKVRRGQHIDDPSNHVDQLLEWLEQYFEQQAQEKKTEKGVENQRQAKQSKINTIKQNRQLLESVFQIADRINRAKIILVRQLERVENLKHFIPTEQGLKVTAPEGFVAVDHLSDSAVKLVDRLEFSKANFAKQ